MGRKKKEPPPAVRRRKQSSADTGPTEMRTFLAFALPDDAMRVVRETVSPLRDQMLKFRWVDPVDWHITIKFFGDLRPIRVEAAARAIRSVPRQPIPFVLRGFGAFPDQRQPHTLWIGAQDPGTAMTKLHRAVEDACAEEGLDRDTRRYRPHLTVARVNPDDSRPVARELSPVGDKLIYEGTLERMVLLRSLRYEHGSVYKAVEEFRLSGRRS